MADLSPNLLKQPKGLAPSRLENDPLWHVLDREILPLMLYNTLN